MKRFYTLGLTSIAVLTLSACSSTKGSSNASTGKMVDGPITKVGDYNKADKEDGKTTLLAIKDMNKTEKVGDLTYHFGKAKLLKIEATTKNQKSMDEGNWGESLKNTYYEYQLEYSVKNNGKTALSGGDAEIITPDGLQLSTNSGGVDFMEYPIQGGAKKKSYFQSKASKKDVKHLKDFKFVTGDAYSEDDDSMSITGKTVSFK